MSLDAVWAGLIVAAATKDDRSRDLSWRSSVLVCTRTRGTLLGDEALRARAERLSDPSRWLTGAETVFSPRQITEWSHPTPPRNVVPLTGKELTGIDAALAVCLDAPRPQRAIRPRSQRPLLTDEPG